MAVSVTVLQKSINDKEKRNQVNHRALEKQEKCPSSNKDKVDDVSVVQDLGVEVCAILQSIDKKSWLESRNPPLPQTRIKTAHMRVKIFRCHVHEIKNHLIRYVVFSWSPPHCESHTHVGLWHHFSIKKKS